MENQNQKGGYAGELYRRLPDGSFARVQTPTYLEEKDYSGVREMNEDELKDFEQRYADYDFERLPEGESPANGDFVIDHDEDGTPYHVSHITKTDGDGRYYGNWREGGVMMPEQDIYPDKKQTYYRRRASESAAQNEESGNNKYGEQLPDKKRPDGTQLDYGTLNFLNNVKKR